MGRATIALNSSRRDLIRGVVGAVGLVSAHRGALADDEPDRLPPQAGDRFVIVTGALQDEVVRAELLKIGAPQVECFPVDPLSGIVRRANRLNRVLAIRLNPDEMSEGTRAASADGVLIYSAICTHTGCTVKSWMPQEQRLRCPCHLSQFAALDEGKVEGGPAKRPLAMIPLVPSADGFIEAAGGFTRKPGFQK